MSEYYRCMAILDPKAAKRGAALLLVVAACVGVSTASVRVEPPDEIRAFLDRFVTAFDNLDWPVFIGMFDDDATIFYPSPPNAPIRATGRREFEAAWRRVFQGIRGSRTTAPFMELRPERVHVQMLTGAAVVTFELHDVPGQTGRRTLILRRHHDVWRIAHLHASNVPTSPVQ
jgi:ketosteroid isomerase-like protein